MTKIIINNINTYIKQNHIKQTWIAQMLGTSKMNISNILSGRKKNTSLEELMDIINILDLDFEDISKKDYTIKVTSTSDGELYERTAYCGSVNNKKTKETLECIIDLIEIIDIFKTSNRKANFY